MKNKRYVLMTIEEDYMHEGFARHHFKLFENYFNLQQHLNKFKNVEKNKYIVFCETNIKRDNSLYNKKVSNLYE